MNYVTNIIIDPMNQVVTGSRERKVTGVLPAPTTMLGIVPGKVGAVIVMPDAMNSSPTIFPVDKNPRQFWTRGV